MDSLLWMFLVYMLMSLMIAATALSQETWPDVLAIAVAASPAALLSFLGLIGLCLWRFLRLLSVRAQPARIVDDGLAEMLGCRFDPVKGVMIDLLRGTERFSAVINPVFWHLLPSGAISSQDVKEAAVIGSPVTALEHGKEPASLVTLTNGTNVVGMGSRVTYQGNTYLLTASHVWYGRSEKISILKGDLQVEVSVEKYKPAYGSTDEYVDFVMIPIPQAVWTKLGVKSASFKSVDKRTTVVVYGGTTQKCLFSSTGMATCQAMARIHHGATTGRGWSGSPLYHGSAVVGVHLAQKELGVENRGINARWLLDACKESVFSENSFTGISADEAELRDYDFKPVEMIGQKKLYVGGFEYYTDPHKVDKHIADLRAKGKKVWSDAFDEEDDDTYYDSLETQDEHLNVQRRGARRSPPPELLATTNGPILKPALPAEVRLDVLAKACPSTTVDDRLASLERTLERLTLLVSDLQKGSSQSLNSSAGPSEEPKQNSDPSSSSPAGSKRRRRRKASVVVVTGSPADTPKPNPVNASPVPTGAGVRSRRRRRKSAAPKSTPTPPQASPSRS